MEELLKEVTEMRRLQKEYFRTRGSKVLTQAREAEKRVDNLIALMEKPNLFS